MPIRVHVVTATLFLLASCRIPAPQSANKGAADLSGETSGRTFTVDSIVARLTERSKNGESIMDGVQFIRELKVWKASMFEMASPVFASRSIQRATVTGPRMLTMPQEGTFVMGTMTDLGPDGCRQHEFLDLVSPTAFPYVIRTREFNFGTGGVSVSEPAVCTFCHGDPVKPLLDEYPVWSGFHVGYDFAFDLSQPADQKIRDFEGQRAQRLRSSLTQSPSKCLSTFASAVGNNPQYPFVYTPIRRYLSDRPLHGEINANLLAANFTRIASQIVTSPDFEAWKFAIYGAAAGCENLESFLPEPLRQSMKVSLQEFIDRTAKDVEREEMAISRRFAALHLEGETLPLLQFGIDKDRILSIAGFRYIFENRGHSIDHWTMAPFPRKYSFSHGGFATGIFTPLYRMVEYYAHHRDALLKRSEGFPPLFHLNDDLDKSLIVNPFRVCSDLHRQSLGALAALNSIPSPSDKAGHERGVRNHFGDVPVVNRCLSCHAEVPTELATSEDGQPPPTLEFDQPEELGRRLAIDDGALAKKISRRIRSADPRLRMPPPPWRPLTDKEISATEEFIKRAISMGGRAQ